LRIGHDDGLCRSHENGLAEQGFPMLGSDFCDNDRHETETEVENDSDSCSRSGSAKMRRKSCDTTGTGTTPGTGTGTGTGTTTHTEHEDLDNDLTENHGMRVERSADGHMEVHDSQGNRYSYRLNSGAASGGACPAGQTVCYSDADDGHGSMVVGYSSGKTETAHAEAHNGNELTEHARQQGYSVVSTSNGVVTVRNSSNGNTVKVRYGSKLTQGTPGQSAGIRVESDGRIVVRYNDGLEQEIVPTP
jgi:hypothetical protein